MLDIFKSKTKIGYAVSLKFKITQGALLAAGGRLER